MAGTIAALVAASILMITLALLSGSGSGARRLWSRTTLTSIGQLLAARFPELLSLDSVERRLIWASRPYELQATEFLAARLLLAAGCLLTGYLLGGITFAVLGGAGGLFWPDLWLNGQVRKRQLRIERDLSQFLDYWTAAVEAGLDLMPAVERVAKRMSGPLAQEFRLASQEVAIGYPRAVALTHVADRCGVADLSQVIAVLVAADRYGTSVAEQLRIASRELWAQRTARARTRAAQVGVAMRGPLLFLILPGLLAMMLAPVVWHLKSLFN